jgi:hypothetical protein
MEKSYDMVALRQPTGPLLSDLMVNEESQGTWVELLIIDTVLGYPISKPAFLINSTIIVIDMYVVLFRLKGDARNVYRKTHVWGTTPKSAQVAFVSQMDNDELENGSFYLLAEKHVFESFICRDKPIIIIDHEMTRT